MVAVRWYLRYGLSYRDVEELLAECGIEVDHVTVFRWVQRCHRTGQHDTAPDSRRRPATTLRDGGSGFGTQSPDYIHRYINDHGRPGASADPGRGRLVDQGARSLDFGDISRAFSGSQWFRERWQTGPDGGRRVAEHKIGIDRRLRWPS